MLKLKSKVLPVAVGAAVIVGGANLTAYAANGHAFLLGSHNHASKTTSLAKSGKGPALSLHTSKKSPPFAVNSSKTVKHLNAALVGGKSAADLKTSTRTYTVPAGTLLPFSFSLGGVPQGTYLASYDMTLTTTTTVGRCFLNTAGHETALGYGAVNGTFTVVSATQLVQVTSAPVTFQCNSATAVDNEGENFRSTITFVRVDSNVSGSTTQLAHAPHAKLPPLR